METNWIVFVISLAILAVIYISAEVVLRIKDKRIAELRDENSILKGRIDQVRKDRDALYECYMASLEREARNDG